MTIKYTTDPGNSFIERSELKGKRYLAYIVGKEENMGITSYVHVQPNISDLGSAANSGRRKHQMRHGTLVDRTMPVTRFRINPDDPNETFVYAPPAWEGLAPHEVEAGLIRKAQLFLEANREEILQMQETMRSGFVPPAETDRHGRAR